MGIYPTDAMLNALVFLPVELQPMEAADPRDDVLACATEIRKSVGKLKDPESIKAMATHIAKIQSQAAWNRSPLIVDWKPTALFVNITRRWVPSRSTVNRR